MNRCDRLLQRQVAPVKLKMSKSKKVKYDNKATANMSSSGIDEVPHQSQSGVSMSPPFLYPSCKWSFLSAVRNIAFNCFIKTQQEEQTVAALTEGKLLILFQINSRFKSLLQYIIQK